MFDPRQADHVVGLELQIEELVEQRERARVQRREQDARTLDWQIDDLYQQLADVTDALIDAASRAMVDNDLTISPERPQRPEWPRQAPPAA